jgi:hypothetical protein
MTCMTSSSLHNVIRIEVGPERESCSSTLLGHPPWSLQVVTMHMADGSTHSINVYLEPGAIGLPVTETPVERRAFRERPPMM